MLRLPPFAYHRPTSLDEALSLLAVHGDEAMLVAGGTDVMPNLKHRLHEPSHLVALGEVGELRGIEVEGDWLRIGAGETLSAVAADPDVRRLFPALADAAAHVAGPQIRNMGTLGGNLCLDTRCTYYNQTEFWRRALGYCLKKDGTVCHVTRVGKKCVAAHSADTPPVLWVLGAVARLAGPRGTRELPVRDFFVADGIQNTRRERDEIVVDVRIPLAAANRRTAYAKLRQRNAIDFPLLTVAVSIGLDSDGGVLEAGGVVTALGSRPRELTGWQELAEGRPLDGGLIAELAARAHAQCRPLENISVDPEWRRAMVPVYVRRALEKARG